LFEQLIMSGNRVVKTLYCALLRLAMKFDKKRASKSMIYTDLTYMMMMTMMMMEAYFLVVH
jgi:hypothetical protein